MFSNIVVSTCSINKSYNIIKAYHQTKHTLCDFLIKETIPPNYRSCFCCWCTLGPINSKHPLKIESIIPLSTTTTVESYFPNRRSPIKFHMLWFRLIPMKTSKQRKIGVCRQTDLFSSTFAVFRIYPIFDSWLKSTELCVPVWTNTQNPPDLTSNHKLFSPLYCTCVVEKQPVEISIWCTPTADPNKSQRSIEEVPSQPITGDLTSWQICPVL